MGLKKLNYDTWRVDDGEQRVTGVAQPVSRVGTGLLRHGGATVVQAHNL